MTPTGRAGHGTPDPSDPHGSPGLPPLYGEGPASEERLIDRAKEGDGPAYDRLVRAHYPRVHATAFRLLGNPEDAEDLAQECFVRAHRSLSWYRGDGSFAGWLRRILVHLARDRMRREGARPTVGPVIESAEPATERGPLQELHGRELIRLVRDAIHRLPEHLRIPLVLRTREGLPYDEIASAIGITPATARTQVMKARRALLRSLSLYVADRRKP